jgi:16S rRNA (cytosine967-C5)-methyltransferase
MVSVREIALKILVRCLKEGTYSNLQLKNELKSEELSHLDKGLLTQLVNGTLEKSIYLDYCLAKFSKMKLSKMSAYLLSILRLGAYQILFLDKIPDSAACNESVKLGKKYIGQSISGIINGILRSISREKENIELPKKENDIALHFSIQFSVPKWLVELWLNSYGYENTVKILEGSSNANQTAIRINTTKTTFEALKSALEITKHPFLNNAANIHFSEDLENINAFKDGLFYIQDSSSQLCCEILNPQNSENILDVCAAPGGKSFTIAQNCGNVCSVDLYEQRTALIIDGAKRLGLTNIKALCANSTQELPFPKKSFDKILCDVPCSGLGVIRKKPDIMFKNPEKLKELPALQYEILKNASHYLKTDGILIYSTCTLNPNENELVLKKFLEENKAFELVNIDEFILKEINCIKENGYMTILPDLNCDGFFISKIKRIV